MTIIGITIVVIVIISIATSIANTITETNLKKTTDKRNKLLEQQNDLLLIQNKKIMDISTQLIKGKEGSR